MEHPDVCRNCGNELPPRYAVCPQCGVRKEGPQGYEWKSKGTWMGEPLVHIAFGTDSAGRVRTARGIVAIGQRASGAVAIGIVAVGGLSIGLVSCGLVSVGVVAVALGAAFGMNAFAPFAIGVLGVGYAAGGVKAIGWKILFSA
ncbi:hypothetical protein ACXR0O_17640 [Verrucomicrobiota bacterium sgz303538]